MPTLTFTDTHNMVAFLEKPTESDGFHEIIDFLNANQFRYALTVNPKSTHLAFNKTSIRSDLYLEDAGGTDCLPTSTIFEELAQMGAKSTAWNEFSSTMASLIICLATNQRFNLSKYIFDAMLGDMSHHKQIYVNPSHTKKIFANMKREGKDFSGRITPLFERMMVQPTQDEGVDSGLERLKKVSMSRRVESSEDQESLGDHEDASKHGRSIEDIDKDADVSLVDDTQRRSDDADMFDIDDLHGDEVNVDMPVGDNQEQSVKEREVDTSVEDSVAPTTIEEITLAQTLIQIKAAKPKVVTTTATTTTTTRHKARGVVVHEPSEFKTPQEAQPLMIKDKGKGIMIEPEVPLKRKDQVALDEDLARNLQAQLEAEIIEEEKLARKQDEEANIALIESWDNTQAMIEADFELAQRLQTKEEGEITIKE
ncbi:hypothetical protein Tco_0488640 [Tanacetum coccineum]